MPVIGFLGSASAEPSAGFLAMFRSGLEETGYVEGQNVTIEYRWAENQYDRLPGLAADLVRRRVSVIVAAVDRSRQRPQKLQPPPSPLSLPRHPTQ